MHTPAKYQCDQRAIKILAVIVWRTQWQQETAVSRIFSSSSGVSALWIVTPIFSPQRSVGLVKGTPRQRSIYRIEIASSTTEPIETKFRAVGASGNAALALTLQQQHRCIVDKNNNSGKTMPCDIIMSVVCVIEGRCHQLASIGRGQGLINVPDASLGQSLKKSE